ncbi:MAG: hypothetical protein EKK34_29435 [Mycobacterium sp.]|nr:MAG: hypothetical protein EKK34_29435 [Mycobacterium sp.]
MSPKPQHNQPRHAGLIQQSPSDRPRPWRRPAAPDCAALAIDPPMAATRRARLRRASDRRCWRCRRATHPTGCSSRRGRPSRAGCCPPC